MPITNTGTGLVEPEIDSISGDRRSRPRFEFRLPLHYRVLKGKQLAGSGLTRNLSSGGVAFEALDDLSPGTFVELAIQWPVALQETTPLELVARGHVAWSEGGMVAVRLTRTHFRARQKVSGAAGGSGLL